MQRSGQVSTRGVRWTRSAVIAVPSPQIAYPKRAINEHQAITLGASQPSQPYSSNRPCNHPRNRVYRRQPWTLYGLRNSVDDNTHRYPQQKDAPEESLSQTIVIPRCHDSPMIQVSGTVGIRSIVETMSVNFVISSPLGTRIRAASQHGPRCVQPAFRVL